MKEETRKKAVCLIRETRVMTLAVSDKDIPWTSPVYFVFHDKKFYFLSNENARHIRYAQSQKPVSAVIFHDSDRMDRIFGFQMSGRIEAVLEKSLYMTIVKKYVSKFSFLNQIFGSKMIEHRQFFFEKFKSRLYCFCPDDIFLSDNSRTSGKRSRIELSQIV